MRSFIKSQLWPAVSILLALTVITGLIYPAVVTAVAQVAFPGQANGSMIAVDGQTVGSSLIGQSFDDPKYFSGRPSAAGTGYDPTLSGGSNLAPTSQALIDRITAQVDALRKANGNAPIPVDLVTTSASGLDPHITLQNAEFQLDRVAAKWAADLKRDPAAVRGEIAGILRRHTLAPWNGLIGEKLVNVLEVNLELRKQYGQPS